MKEEFEVFFGYRNVGFNFFFKFWKVGSFGYVYDVDKFFIS